MSEGVITALIGAGITLLTTVATHPLWGPWLQARQKRRLDEYLLKQVEAITQDLHKIQQSYTVTLERAIRAEAEVEFLKKRGSKNRAREV